LSIAIAERIVHGDPPVSWGYCAELMDPDGYPVRSWDKITMPGYKEN
jgi:hypothetical protein